MIRVLFVCLGNICRSPMAEAVFRHMLIEENLADAIEVDSAGLGSWHVGERPHEGTLHQLEAHGIDHAGLYARQVRPSDIMHYDYIVAMDAGNLQGLKDIASGRTTHLSRLMDLVAGAPTLDVPDPYYTNTFDEVYDLIEAGCGALLGRIKQDHGLRCTGA